MKLTLVKQGDFLGTKCDFYVNEQGEIFMSRTQIGYALKYKNPQDAIKKIHQRHFEQLNSKYVELVGDNLTPTPKDLRKKTSIFMYNEKGIYDVVRWSTTSVADDYFDWVYEKIQEIKKNGYYIATEKDNKWLGIREEGKAVRKSETDVIKVFVEYAKNQGSQNADRYYTILSKLVNSKLGILSGQRDDISQQTLMEIKTLEGLISMRLNKLMKNKTNYKDVYKDIKNLIESI